MNNMFVVYREWGEYPDHGKSIICLAHSKDEADRVVRIMKELSYISKRESEAAMRIADNYWKTLNFETLPSKPKKSIVDPDDRISQKDWMNNYLQPYMREFREAADRNSALEEKIVQKIEDYKRSVLRQLPDYFDCFKKFLRVSYSYPTYETDYRYTITEIPIFVSNEVFP